MLTINLSIVILKPVEIEQIRHVIARSKAPWPIHFFRFNMDCFAFARNDVTISQVNYTKLKPEMLQKSHIIFKKHSQICNSIFQHRKAFHTNSEGESLEFFGINIAVF